MMVPSRSLFPVSLLTFLMPLIVLAVSCANQRHLVVAATGTNIGVEISENPATQMPQAKLGYQRTELAIVPTNRSASEKAIDGSLKGGTKDVADVLMELRYGGIFDKGPTSGIYQRLAVGKIAVSRPGASLMFAKDAAGTVDRGAEKALKAVKGIPVTDSTSRISMRCLNAHREDAAKAAIINDAIKKVTTSEQNPNGLDWDDLVDDPNPEIVKSVIDEIKPRGVTCP